MVLTAVLSGIVGAGVMWFMAGRETGPTITISAPDKFIGRATSFSFTIDSPSEIAGSSFYFEQNGKPLPVANVKNEQVDGKLVMSGTVGREGAVNGPVSLRVEAGRKTFFGLRTVSSEARRELTARLDPPRAHAKPLVARRSLPQDWNLGVAERRHSAAHANEDDLVFPLVQMNLDFRAWRQVLQPSEAAVVPLSYDNNTEWAEPDDSLAEPACSETDRDD